MPYLTHEEVQEVYSWGPPHRMMVVHRPDWWNDILNYNLPNPVRIKFDKDIRDNMPVQIRNGKGIYMFFIEPNHSFPNQIEMKHLLYVGRVQGGATNFSFFKRFYSYVNAIGNRTAKRNIMRLTNLWPNQTFVYYFDLATKTDTEIIDIEENIINKIIPPLNEELKGEARQTRQLY